MRWIVCLVLGLAACTTSHSLHPSQLSVLDPKLGAKVFETEKGFTFDVDRLEDIEIRLTDGKVLEGKVGDLAVDGRNWMWKTKLRIEPESIEEVKIDETSAGGLLIGVSAVVGLVLLIPIIVIASAPPAGGRPLRIRGRVHVARPQEASGWGEGKSCDPTLSSTAREALADHWLRVALDEHASVPAFARISTSLVALGAPRELVEACHRAALDEIDHATRTFALASSYAGRTFAPGPLHSLLATERDARAPELHLRKLALETLEDGCLGEGVAAELAREALLHATDRDVKATLAVISRDEAAHHELAWRILWWCCTTGGAPVREAVRDKLGQLPRTIMPRRVDARIVGDLKRHGYVEAERQRAIFGELREYTVSRAQWILDGIDRRAA